VDSVASELTTMQLSNIDAAFKHLRSWKGKFDASSTAATVYSYAMLKIYDSLLHQYLDSDKRSKMVDSYEFSDFFSRLVNDIKEHGGASRFNSFCVGHHDFYKGENACAYNFALAFN
jgi:hypothetical protein